MFRPGGASGAGGARRASGAQGASQTRRSGGIVGSSFKRLTGGATGASGGWRSARPGAAAKGQKAPRPGRIGGHRAAGGAGGAGPAGGARRRGVGGMLSRARATLSRRRTAGASGMPPQSKAVTNTKQFRHIGNARRHAADFQSARRRGGITGHMGAAYHRFQYNRQMGIARRMEAAGQGAQFRVPDHAANVLRQAGHQV
jgi:hypothetical protein